MKTFVWLLTLGLTLACGTGWVMAELVEHSLRATMAAVSVPAFTRWMILPHGWLLLAPVPWWVAAGILQSRPEVSTKTALVFAGCVWLAGVILAGVLIIALSLPFLPRHA